MTHTVWAWTIIKWNNIAWLGVPFEIQPKEAIRQNRREKIAFSAELQTKPFIWISVSTCMYGFLTDVRGPPNFGEASNGAILECSIPLHVIISCLSPVEIKPDLKFSSWHV